MDPTTPWAVKNVVVLDAALCGAIKTCSCALTTAKTEEIASSYQYHG